MESVAFALHSSLFTLHSCLAPPLAGPEAHLARMRFGIFLAPHHPIGEHPTLQLRRDIELGVMAEELGFDEFWAGEHHSAGWETIGSPELLLAAVGERTSRIRLGTGVVSL